MNDRERFVNQMHYRPVDRCPIWDFGFWSDTIRVWERFGLPEAVNTDEFFGMDQQWRIMAVDIGLRPCFQDKVLADEGETEVVIDAAGVTFRRRKFLTTIPHYIDWTLKDGKSWQEHFKWRLDPETPGRIPDAWPQDCARQADDRRDYPLGIVGGSLFGWLRNWMGVENLSLLIYDDPTLFPEMVETLGSLWYTVLERALRAAKEAGCTFDYASLWEDMCYNRGPLISPQLVRDVMGPQYKRVTGLLRQYGCDVAVLDCDGKVDDLIPIWLESGVNVAFPLEVGTWGADPIEYRKRFGRELLIMGGFDKHILAKGKDAIRREIERLAPLAEEGGFIPFCDHRVPADVPLENYLYYIEQAKAIWGKGVNVRPTGQLTEKSFEGRPYTWEIQT
jgi:uroporphyrinogen decarboxylase